MNRRISIEHYYKQEYVCLDIFYKDRYYRLMTFNITDAYNILLFFDKFRFTARRVYVRIIHIVVYGDYFL